MKRTAWMWLAIPIAIVSTACGGDDQAGGAPAAAASRSPTTPASSSEATEPDDTYTPGPVPDGTYVAQTTGAEALEAGLTDQEIEEIYGPDGLLQITLKLLGGNWTQYADYTTPGVPEPGDGGTYQFEPGQLVMTSTSPGCPGCVAVMDFTFDGNQLSLRFPDPPGDPVASLILEHDYTKAD